MFCGGWFCVVQVGLMGFEKGSVRKDCAGTGEGEGCAGYGCGRRQLVVVWYAWDDIMYRHNSL